jgi:hypothetical protein
VVIYENRDIGISVIGWIFIYLKEDDKLTSLMQLKRTRKILAILMAFFLVVLLFDLPKAYGAENEIESLSQLDIDLTEQGIELLYTDEWITGENKNNVGTEISLQAKLNGKAKFIHNNGKPIKTDIISPDENGNTSYLVGVYQTELDGSQYEKYFFSNINYVDIFEIKDEVVNITKLIKANPKAYINKLTNGKAKQLEQEKEEPEKTTDVSISAIVIEPSGGYWRDYKWTYYHPYIGIKSGVFTSSLHFDRKSYGADINGVQGSVWDIHSFNQYEAEYYRIDIMRTRMDVNYSAQRIHSYGPSDDAGFDVKVDLTNLVSPSSWSFGVGSVITNNMSSIANKYGYWSWTHTWDFMQDPFVTEPGMRVSNTSGSLAIKHSHTHHTSYAYWHGTGVVTTYIPDR